MEPDPLALLLMTMWWPHPTSGATGGRGVGESIFDFLIKPYIEAAKVFGSGAKGVGETLWDFFSSLGDEREQTSAEQEFADILNTIGHPRPGMSYPTDLADILAQGALARTPLSRLRPIARMVGGIPMYVPYDPNYQRTMNPHWLSML